ncbi:putative membrane protein [Collimonas arenae]|nr:putative membrane protein [Collimonas arenae]
MSDSRWAEERRHKMRSSAEAISLWTCGGLGLFLVLMSSQASSDITWWNSVSYFVFVFGTVLTVMFVAASIEKSSTVTQMLKYNSVKLLCAFLFSAAVVYSSAQASTLLNGIFGVDSSNLPFARALLSAAFFMKMCTPVLFILAFFSLAHIVAIWVATKEEDFYSFPWGSVIFIVAALFSAGSYWWITHKALGDDQIKVKAYKLAHYLDFNSKAYCIDSSSTESYLFFGNDQNKLLIDQKLEIDESFEDFLKGTASLGEVTIPSRFKVLPCTPNDRALKKAAITPQDGSPPIDTDAGSQSGYAN